MTKLNLGCGLQCPDKWTNIDSSIGVRISKHPFLKKLLYKLVPKKWGILPNIEWPSNTFWMDLTQRFTFADDSVSYVYSSHTFEHLSYSEAEEVFLECYRVLKSDGLIRIVVPDFECLINSYLDDKLNNPKGACKRFHLDSGYFEHGSPSSLLGLLVYFFKRKNNHYFLYDESALRVQFEKAGFTDVKRMQYRESGIPEISEIDIESRFHNSICLEGRKK